MFDSVRPRSRASGIALVALAIGLTALWWTRPELLRRTSLLLAGANPLAEPFATERADQIFPESPLAVSLELEQQFGPVEREATLAFADDLARDLGFWLLETTGASDVEDAERRLWATGDGDRFAVAWALRLQARHVYARRTQRLSGGAIPSNGDPIYVHPDELALLLAHVAWRLDLASDLVRSPIHLYLVLREPGGTRARGVEPTCFRRVDALGRVAPSDEPSVGRRLSFPPHHFPSGIGGIPNPTPLPPGVYEPVSADALAGDIQARLTERYAAEAPVR